ncbi:MAG: SH3 domain-containing protein [Proteobacteria bacterium]|nr:SH3 domain-containing protein [Pseudomonadota bacterium]
MRAVLAAALLSCAALAQAADFRSIGEGAAVMYDAPSRASTPIYVASRFYPVELIVNLDAWVKVRDHTGTLSWVEKKSLSERRMVIVTAPNVEVKSRAEDGAPAAFQVTQNVALDLVEIGQGGWVRVRHADGATGFVRASVIWGL